MKVQKVNRELCPCVISHLFIENCKKAGALGLKR